MEFWSVTLVGLAVGLVLVIGGALVIYMGSLVQSAYQLKIEIKADVDEGLRRLEQEVEKKLRWIKRDLIEEVDKVKTAMQTDNQRKLSEVLDGFISRLTKCEEALLADRTEAAQVLEGLRHDVTLLDQQLRLMRRERKTVPPVAPDGPEGPLSASPAVEPPAAAAEPEAPPPSTAPASGEDAPDSPA